MKDLRANARRSGIVERRTMGAYHNGRRLIVSLEPGDTITMRVVVQGVSIRTNFLANNVSRKHPRKDINDLPRPRK